MTEQIGKIILDLSKYPGRDFYCDGATEDELLEIVKTYPESEYGRVIEERKSWTLLYHLSHLRENIVDWIPMTKEMKVLEVGSGCGAITGALSRKAGSVTCVDLSKKRSSINAWRHRECENVRIHVGNFKDIEPDLDTDYDMICLIGVFEYGQGYIGGETPYEDFLRILQKHIKKDGKIVIAIENKYGLKYFAGCREDHAGTYFEGIENYARGGGVRTFGKNGLENIFKSCGVEEYHFYYPYPDYKFMTTLYSDERKPGKGELSNNIRNFDRERLLLFDEKDAFDGILEEDLFSVFSNSYLVVLGKESPVKYVKYSNDRAAKYQIRTEICVEKTEDGNIWSVCKRPMTQEAHEHVRGMGESYRKLQEKYSGSRLEMNRCVLTEDAEGPCARFEYVEGTPLSELLDQCLEQGNTEEFKKLFECYVSAISYGEEKAVSGQDDGIVQATDWDLIFSNFLVNGDQWTLIDYEWMKEEYIPAKELAYRALYCYWLEDKDRSRIDLAELTKDLGISEVEARNVIAREQEFQREVDGNQLSFAQMHADFGERVEVPLEAGIRNCEDRGEFRVQVYKDYGNGYSEENAFFLQDAYKDGHRLEIELEVSDDVKMLRIDPLMSACICRVLELNFNGRPVSARRRGHIVVNGKKSLVKKDAQGIRQLSFIFPTMDPNINIGIRKLNPQKKNLLTMKLEVARVPLAVAEEMAGALKEKKLYFL